MPTDQETEANPVATGLAGLALNEPTSVSPVSETAPTPSADVPLVQVSGLGDDVTVKVAEINDSALVADHIAQQRAQKKSHDQLAREESDAIKRAFYEKLSMRREPEKAYVPPPVPERIAENTRLEMEAGRKRVAEFAEQQASRPRPAPNVGKAETAGTTTAVFRPAEFDEYKDTLKSPAQTVSKDNIPQPLPSPHRM